MADAGRTRRCLPSLVLTLVLAAGERAAAQPSSLVVALSQPAIGVTTGFTGAELLVFGATERPLGPRPNETPGDDLLVVVHGPPKPVTVRRRVRVAGVLWVNGAAARFPRVPGFYAIAGTRPAWQLLPEPLRQTNALGLDALPLASIGARNPGYRSALLQLETEAGLWLEDTAEVAVDGGRLFHVRLPLPATVPTGDYLVEVLLVRAGTIAERRRLPLRVDRLGAAAEIAGVARGWPLLYGIGCVLLAGLAGWLGSVVFRRV